MNFYTLHKDAELSGNADVYIIKPNETIILNS